MFGDICLGTVGIRHFVKARSVSSVAVGDRLDLMLKDGRVECSVESVIRDVAG